MASLNETTFIGNLVADPVLRNTASGKAVCNFRMAVNEVSYNDNNEKIDLVTWLNVTAWGDTASYVSKYLKKGQQVYVSGRLRLESWDREVTAPNSQEVFVVKSENTTILASKVLAVGNNMNDVSTDGMPAMDEIPHHDIEETESSTHLS